MENARIPSRLHIVEGDENGVLVGESIPFDLSSRTTERVVVTAKFLYHEHDFVVIYDDGNGKYYHDQETCNEKLYLLKKCDIEDRWVYAAHSDCLKIASQNAWGV